MSRGRWLKPEFFRSKVLAGVPLRALHTFTGIWCFADDSGAMLDDADVIKADVWLRVRAVSPEDVEDDLLALAEAGVICRYAVAGKRYLHVLGWDDPGCDWFQKINNPSKYRLPACPEDHGPPGLFATDALTQDSVSTNSALTQDSVSHLTRLTKTRLTKNTSPALARFDEFYAAYPRHEKRPAAERAWAKAVTRADPDKIITAVRRYAADPNLPERQYVPHPATWLNQDRWGDDPLPARGEQRSERPETADMATSWEGRPR